MDQENNNMNIGDKFVSILSSAAKLPLKGSNSVYSIFDSLISESKQNKDFNHKRFLLTLEELGFLYISYKRKKIFIEPPIIVNSTTDPFTSYLVGARTPNLIDTIRATSKTNKIHIVIDTSSKLLPKKIILKDNKKIQQL